MRLARPSDKAAVARTVDARCDWMEARELPSWRSARDSLVTQCDNPERDVWVLDDEVAGVIGQTVVQRQGPPWGWTEAERGESALYLSGSITDPEAKGVRPGALMAWWTVDRAARQGVPWVRRHAQVPEVAAYHRSQGFTLVREEQRTHARLYMLARKAERLDLSPWLGQDFKERPCRLVQGDHLDQLRPRVLAVGAVLRLVDGGLLRFGRADGDHLVAAQPGHDRG
jgi:hypothetical protein